MTFELGPFKLDEDRRALLLAEREVPLQPRVFDLLVFLIRNRTRVVGKDELLSALWPGVTVTEASLQRGISVLRATLREGGMEAAIRSFPRIGYRFCIDDTPECIASDADDPYGLVAAAQATAAQNWPEAERLYVAADGITQLDRCDFDNWALALQCLGRPGDAVPVLVRAVTAHTEASAPDLAALSAVALSTIHMERGEMALAKGWVARAEHLLSGLDDVPARGRLLWMQARLAASDGDPQAALKLADAAYGYGKRLGDRVIEALGLVYRGFFRLCVGDTVGGLADQDHAAALALSSKIDPLSGGTLYCNILWACRTFNDWARANQWTLGYGRFCQDSGMDVSGSCQLHRAEVLAIHGSLHEALALVTDALDRLNNDAPWAIGDAHRVLGDIQSAIGNTDAALAAYDKAHSLGWDAEPGQAMLLMERGELEAALACLERSLIGQSWWTLQRQGMLLAHLALVSARAGRAEKAQSLIDDLAGQPERWPMPSIRALTNEASAVLAGHRGNPQDALRHLHLARQLWSSIDSRIHAARLRIEIAARQLEAGDIRGAATEVRSARIAAEALRSDKMLSACRKLEALIEAAARRSQA